MDAADGQQQHQDQNQQQQRQQQQQQQARLQQPGSRAGAVQEKSQLPAAGNGAVTRQYRREYLQGSGRIFKSGNQEFRLHEITGDGNCMFRAISFILWGTEARHQQLRSMVVSHVEESWRELRSLVLAEWNLRTASEYAARMGPSGAFASELECVLAAKLNRLSLAIYRRADTNGGLRRVLYSELPGRSRVANLLFSGRDDCGHYDVLLPV